MFKLPTGIPNSDLPAGDDSPARTTALIGIFVLAVTVLRAPLWMLPGPGRDEAAYHYWAHHPEPSYSPMVQMAIRLAEGFGGHTLWALRSPVIILGFLVLYLNDRRLAGAGTSSSLRWLAAMVLAFSPWQGFAGSILHPDNFLLASLLALVLASQHNRLWLVVLAAIAAVMSKPTGVLILPVAWWLFGFMTTIDRRQLWAARMVLVLTALVVAFTMKPEMLAGMAEFGLMAPTVPWFGKGMAAAGAALFLGGFLLVGWSIFGFRQRWHDFRTGPDDQRRREARASLAAAGILLAVFIAAALLRGQFKGNWVLPALLLLWPTRLPRLKTSSSVKAFATIGLALTIMTGFGQTAILMRPDLLINLEKKVATRNKSLGWLTYSTQAGVRETSVSTSKTWTDHLHEYDDVTAFAQEVKASWSATQGDTAPMDWIVAGDYGFACQLHWYLGDPSGRVAIFGDGIFHRTWSDFLRAAPSSPLLALSLPAGPDLSGGDFKILTFLPTVKHPITGGFLEAAAVVWQTDANKEQ